MTNEETPLTGGGRTAVARRGDVVAREAGPWAPSVHALLRHLERVGFDGAPRVAGTGFDGQGRELLTYVEGEVIHPSPWSDEAIHDIGRMLRRLHEAAASFRPPAEARWRPWFGRALGVPDVIGHGDAAPWNIVSRRGRPVALIDWEVAGPVDRLTELALAAWNNAQLYDEGVAAMNGLPDAARRIGQVRILAEGYGLSPAERRLLAHRIIDFAAQSAANEAIELGIAPETTQVPRVWGLAWQARSVAWLFRNRSALEAALS
jgi:Ser/Thr protein kinase RdoA (MazF antagonist)